MINHDPVILKRSQMDRASEVLVEAFNNDPMFKYLGIEVETGRLPFGYASRSQVDKRSLKLFIARILQNCQPYNRVYSIANNLKGVAVWVPPGKSEISTWQFLSMLFVLYRRCGWDRTKRYWMLFSSLDKRHQAEMNEPHWMLSLLGVAPSYQSQGIGSLLLQPVLQQADREGLPCYLQTFSQQAVRFYQKHGFAVLWQGKLSEDSPCIWTMKRQPQS